MHRGALALFLFLRRLFFWSTCTPFPLLPRFSTEKSNCHLYQDWPQRCYLFNFYKSSSRAGFNPDIQISQLRWGLAKVVGWEESNHQGRFQVKQKWEPEEGSTGLATGPGGSGKWTSPFSIPVTLCQTSCRGGGFPHQQLRDVLPPSCPKESGRNFTAYVRKSLKNTPGVHSQEPLTHLKL